MTVWLTSGLSDSCPKSRAAGIESSLDQDPIRSRPFWTSDSGVLRVSARGACVCVCVLRVCGCVYVCVYVCVRVCVCAGKATHV